MSNQTPKLNRSDLSPAKQAILAKRLQHTARSTSARAGITRRADARYAPLSFTQEQLWSLAQKEGRPTTYVRAFHLRGALDMAALERTVKELVRRHEALRTTFARVDGQLRQVIDTDAVADFSLLDLSGASDAEEVEARTANALREEAARPFDLQAGPLFRTLLFRVAADHHVLMFTIPHILSDRRSLAVVTGELMALYEAFTQGKPSPLPALPLQFGDFTAWQRQWWNAERLSAERSFWKAQLAGAPSIVELPTDRARHQQASATGVIRCTRSLSRELSLAVKALGQGTDATLFMTCLAAFNVLLYRLTGQSDLVVGSGVAGRTLLELENIVGCFNKFLVYRTRVSDEITFRQLLKSERELVLQVMTHQDAPTEKIFQELAPDDDWQTPRRNIGFALQAAAHSFLPPARLRFESIQVSGHRAKNDLMARIADTGQELSLTFEASPALFNESTVERFLAQFEDVFAAVTLHPDEPLSKLLPLQGSYT